ncbi:hypothetical protein Tco_0847089 [Tanacetum coccineum]
MTTEEALPSIKQCWPSQIRRTKKEKITETELPTQSPSSLLPNTHHHRPKDVSVMEVDLFPHTPHCYVVMLLESSCGTFANTFQQTDSAVAHWPLRASTSNPFGQHILVRRLKQLLATQALFLVNMWALL